MTLYVANSRANPDLITSLLFFDFCTCEYIRVNPDMTFLYLGPLNNKSIDQVLGLRVHRKSLIRSVKTLFKPLLNDGKKNLFLYTFENKNGIVALDDRDLNNQFFEKLE